MICLHIKLSIYSEQLQELIFQFSLFKRITWIFFVSVKSSSNESNGKFNRLLMNLRQWLSSNFVWSSAEAKYNSIPFRFVERIRFRFWSHLQANISSTNPNIGVSENVMLLFWGFLSVDHFLTTPSFSPTILKWSLLLYLDISIIC